MMRKRYKRSNFVVGENSNDLYLISKEEETHGKVTALNFGGVRYEVKTAYVPWGVQEQPGADRVFILGKKQITVVGTEGKTLNEIPSEMEVRRITFIEGLEVAYIYHYTGSRLSVINLKNLAIQQKIGIGRTGIAILKVTTMMASFADRMSSRHQYVNGVRIPQYYSPVYTINTPKGNAVIHAAKQKIYLLNTMTNDVSVFDYTQNKVVKKIGGFKEYSEYLMLAPNEKYLIGVTEYDWKIINTETDKVDLKITIGFLVPVEGVQPYINPEENRLYIPLGPKVIVVDLEMGKRLKDIETNVQNASLYW